MDAVVGCHPPFDKQREFLALADRDVGNKVLHADAVAGRGAGKTIAGVLWMLAAALTYNAGQTLLWTAPTYQMVRDIMLPVWRAIVPHVLYRYNATDHIIYMINGTRILLRSRDRPDRLVGLSVQGVFHDEIGLDPSPAAWDLVLNSIRPGIGKEPGKLFCCSITTPRLGWHQQMIVEGDTPWVKWSTYDNPWADKDRLAQTEAALSPEMARREIYAEWVDMGGRIWSGFVEKHWTEGGNMHDLEWDPHRPYTLAVDLGIRSAWLIIQKTPDERAQDVAVAEWTPNNEGAAQTLQRINEFAQGRAPIRICVGRDVNTRSIGDMTQPSLFFRQQWGTAYKLSVPMGDLADKQWQHNVANGRLLNSRGERRFFVSNKLISHDRGVKRVGRGILDLLRSDSWPDKVPREGAYLPKDKSSGAGYEDMRDAWMYWAITSYPPRMLKGQG